MCEPTTIMLGVGMAVSALGSVAAAQGQSAQGKATNRAAQYRATVAENNAKIREADASNAFLAKRQEAGQRGIKAGADRAKFVAGKAGGGVQVGDGSVVDVAGDITAIGSLDQLSISHQGLRQRQNLLNEATNLRAGAALTRVEGQNAEIAGNSKAGSTLLSGLGKATQSVAGKWDRFSGVPDVSGEAGNTFGGGGTMWDD